MTVEVNQRTSGIYTAILKDELGIVVPSSSLSGLKLSLYDRDSGIIVNTRDNQNVLNTNQVSINGTGNLAWNWLPADMDMVDESNPIEMHVALWTATWVGADGYSRELTHEVTFEVSRVE